MWYQKAGVTDAHCEAGPQALPHLCLGLGLSAFLWAHLGQLGCHLISDILSVCHELLGCRGVGGGG